MTRSRKRGKGRRENRRVSAPAVAAPPEPEEKKIRLRTRLLRRFEGQVQLPGGLALTGLGKLGVVFVVLFAAGALVWLQPWERPWERKAKVPALVGAARADAEKRLQEAHLVLGGLQYEASAEPEGTVLRTDPRIGTELDHDSGVHLVLALHLEPAAVPVPMPAGTRPPADEGAPGGTAGTGGGGHTYRSSSGGGGATIAGKRPEPFTDDAPARVVDRLGDTDARREDKTDARREDKTDARREDKTDAGREDEGKGGDRGTTGVGEQEHKTTPEVRLGAGSASPDPDRNDCATGYQTNFTQQLAMTGAGRVTYRWIRSDGASGPDEHLDVSGPSTETATTYWQRWGAGDETISGWQRLEVIAPVSLLGEKLSFEHVCPADPERSSGEDWEPVDEPG